MIFFVEVAVLRAIDRNYIQRLRAQNQSVTFERKKPISQSRLSRGMPCGTHPAGKSAHYQAPMMIPGIWPAGGTPPHLWCFENLQAVAGGVGDCPLPNESQTKLPAPAVDTAVSPQALPTLYAFMVDPLIVQASNRS